MQSYISTCKMKEDPRRARGRYTWKMKDDMSQDAVESACSLFLRQQCQKKKRNSSSPLKYSSSSVCHDSYQTVVDICVAIRIATPRKDRKRRARCMKGAILSISGQFFFVASRGPHKAFTSSFSWIVQLHQRWIGLIFQRSHWRKSCSISCPRETITHLDIRWAEPSHRID